MLYRKVLGRVVRGRVADLNNNILVYSMRGNYEDVGSSRAPGANLS